jgi:hypothetical protein
VLFLGLLLLAGCAHTHTIYVPREPTPLTPRGKRGATFAIPAGQKRSTARIVPVGVRETAGDRYFRVLLYLDDQSPAPWKLDFTRQKLELDGAGYFAEAPVPPIAEIPKGFARLEQLVFPLPPDAPEIADVKSIRLSWTIDTSDGPVSGITDFVRTMSSEPPEDASLPPATLRRRH